MKIVQSEFTGLELNFVVKRRRAEFVQYVFDKYADGARVEYNLKNGSITQVPNIGEDIVMWQGDIWLESVMAADQENPDALQEAIVEAGDAEQVLELLGELYDEYGTPYYSCYMQEYVEDVIAVCNFYRLSYRLDTYLPLGGVIREIENHALVSVW